MISYHIIIILHIEMIRQGKQTVFCTFCLQTLLPCPHFIPISLNVKKPHTDFEKIKDYLGCGYACLVHIFSIFFLMQAICIYLMWFSCQQTLLSAPHNSLKLHTGSFLSLQTFERISKAWHVFPVPKQHCTSLLKHLRLMKISILKVTSTQIAWRHAH